MTANAYRYKGMFANSLVHITYPYRCITPRVYHCIIYVLCVEFCCMYHNPRAPFCIVPGYLHMLVCVCVARD